MSADNTTMDKSQELNIDDCWNKIGVWRKGEQRCEKLDEFTHCHNCDVYSNAGRSLLNREIPENYGNEWTEILAEDIKSKSTNLQSAVVFRLGPEWLALPVNLINEITLLRKIYEIPHNRNKNLRGMVNIRGELIICMSLGYLLGVDKADEHIIDEEHSINRLIMIKEAGGNVVFPVSEIDGIAHYDPATFKMPPDTVRNSKLNYIKGVFSVRENNIGCIDETALLDAIAGNLK